MIIIPAIDLKNGKCVRLLQGDYNRVTNYSNTPVEQALIWESSGAELIHIVDLDGAKDGSTVNYNLIAKIIEKIKIPVEVGGGVRTIETVKYLESIGVRHIILGTAAVKNPKLLQTALELFPDKITVGIDARNNSVSTDGWLNDSKLDYLEFAVALVKLGCRRIIHTDIMRDGAMQSPNFEALRKFATAVEHAAKQSC